MLLIYALSINLIYCIGINPTQSLTLYICYIAEEYSQMTGLIVDQILYILKDVQNFVESYQYYARIWYISSNIGGSI